jgi:hypothetical protein
MGESRDWQGPFPAYLAAKRVGQPLHASECSMDFCARIRQRSSCCTQQLQGFQQGRITVADAIMGHLVAVINSCLEGAPDAAITLSSGACASAVHGRTNLVP